MLPSVRSGCTRPSRSYFRRVCGCTSSSSAAMLIRNSSWRFRAAMIRVYDLIRIVSMLPGRLDRGRGAPKPSPTMDPVLADVQLADLLTIGLLVLLEGLLSADNALVMAIMVLGLPKPQHRKVLSYGLVGAFAFRILATLLAIYLIKLGLVKLLGGLY